jgi:aminoglycoside phosphotransferase (APT) family kinase protein
VISDDFIKQIVAQALGSDTAVSLRTRLTFQSNQLFDVWQNGRHYIAKKYIKEAEQHDAPRREYAALQLLAPLDIAPQPVFYDPELGPVVIYEFLEGTMWDRAKPTAVQLTQLATLTLQLNNLPTEGLWLSRGMERSIPEILASFHGRFARYSQWAERHFQPGLAAIAPCWALLDRLPALVTAFSQLPDPPLRFCRSDPRFANVIQRPDDRLGLVDWEDCGLRDPARDIADLLTHPNQEDLLTDEEWDVFLRPYTAAMQQYDPHFSERVHHYVPLFHLFWLSILLNSGVSRAEAGRSLTDWHVNELPANIRLHRLMVQALAWPARTTAADLASLAKFSFFPNQ